MPEPDPNEPVDAEVIPPGGAGPKKAAEAPKASRTFFHPLSGFVILVVDWLAFGVELPTAYVSVPIVAVAAFTATFWAVSRIQENHGDEPRMATLKAFLGALAAGVPFPIAGTVLGTAIIMLSGLPKLKSPKLR